jgi:hypothetical protein
MIVYQCLFFSFGSINYWENVASTSAYSIQTVLEQRLSGNEWDAAEAWVDDKLACRVDSVSSPPYSKVAH